MAVVATGFFDGVHLGHRHVIETLVRLAKERGDESLVVTFWPHPRTVLAGAGLTLLTAMEEKIAMLKELGVDRVEVVPFDAAFAAMNGRQYLAEIVKKRFGGRMVVLGYDNRIGCDGLCSTDAADTARELGMDATVAESVQVCGHVVSSSLIRRLIVSGDTVTAAMCLGRPYALEGTVVTGNRIGTSIGFPTANMEVRDALKTIPARGVYAVRVRTVGGDFRGMTNIGVRPTVSGGEGDVTIETNIFDFDTQIYGRDIRVEFIEKIRDEVHFGSLDALVSQLRNDEEQCKEKLLSL